ncbi:MAG TPA: hypothetical protein VMK31_02225, partial [Sphingomicrobium sp.]|nr:hypothetical protein [Sphingomicrobium sp.]
MAEATIEGREPQAARLKPGWSRRLGQELLALLLGLIVLLSVGLVVLDTAPGHRWIVDRIEAIETRSGLR